MELPRGELRRQLLDDVPHSIAKSRRTEAQPLEQISPPPGLTPVEHMPLEPGWVQRMVAEREQAALERIDSEVVQEEMPELQEEAEDEELAPDGWSGLAEHYENGRDDLEFDPEELTWTLLAHRKNSTEVRLKDLTKEQQKQFLEADLKEWEAILKSGAVRVVSAAGARTIAW